MFKINRIIYLLFAMTMLCSCNSFLEEDTISEVPQREKNHSEIVGRRL